MVDVSPSSATPVSVSWHDIPARSDSGTKLFGRYQLRDVLGHGGVGDVYRAYDTVTRRDVALKVLTDHAASDPVNRERFEREAFSAAALNDPHIVPIFDFGSVGHRRYLAMQLIDGVNLSQLLGRQGPLHPTMAVPIIEQIASALDTAHSANVVHRDVKPSNILLTYRDFAYLIDFGIARGLDASTLTGTGKAVGTLAYMAPERFHGRATASSDIYALTCVLYECLTGSRPFPGSTMESQVSSHLNTPAPRPSEVRPGLPASFDGVIARGMAKRESDRYSTARELGMAARQALTWKPPPPRPVAAPAPRPAPEPPPVRRPASMAAPVPRPVPAAAPIPRAVRAAAPVPSAYQPPIPVRRHPPPPRRRFRSRSVRRRFAGATAVFGVFVALVYGAMHLSKPELPALSERVSTYHVDRTMADTEQSTVTLTDIVIGDDGQMRVFVQYDVHEDFEGFCPAREDDLSRGFLTLSDGTTIYMTDSYCSNTYPDGASVSMTAGSTHTEWGIFPEAPPSGQSFTLNWYDAQTDGLTLN